MEEAVMLQMMKRAVLLQVTLAQHTCNTERGLTRGFHKYSSLMVFSWLHIWHLQFLYVIVYYSSATGGTCICTTAVTLCIC